MRTTLDLYPDVVNATRELATTERRSIGAVISELARRGLTPAKIEHGGRFPVVRTPAGARPITPEIVRRALDEN